MKKLLCLLMSVIILLCVCQTALAALETRDLTENPIIVVPGYSATQMYYINANGEKEHAWGVRTDEIISMVLANIVEVGAGLGMLTIGKSEYISKTVGQGMLDLYGDLAMNDDGTSINDLKIYYTSAEETCSETLWQLHPDGDFQHEGEIMKEVAGYIGGYGKIFNFTCDFRTSAADCAARLDSYIQDVLEYTGKDKVNIMAVSHGGQTTAAYLALYGHKKQIDNAVLNVPAIGGAGLAYDILRGDVDFDEETLLRFVEHGMMWEEDYNWLVQANELGFLDGIIEELLPYVYKLLGNWESIWDFIPTEYYEAMKAKHLDAEKNAELIKSSDYFHYELTPKIKDCFQKCIDDYDMNVSIIAGTDNPVTSGLDVSSDGIILTTSSTGATVAPLGKRFADGYTAINGKDGYVSPAMTVDASTAFLPDNTWFVEGLFHGMEYKDQHTIDLLMKLLLTDDITDVYTDARFPRFHATTNTSSSVFAAYNKSVEGSVSSADTALNVTNLSKKYKMKILAVTVDGMDVSFKLPKGATLEPQGSISLDIQGEIPKVGKTLSSVTVSYMLVGSITPVNERTLYFTINNGEAPAYNPDEPYVETGKRRVDGILNDYWSGILDGAGLKRLASIIYNVLTYFITNVIGTYFGK